MAGGCQELAHRVARDLANCNPSLTFGIGGVVKIKLGLRNVLSESSLCDILDLPEKLAKDLGRTFVIAFDEFQEVGEMSREFALEKVFRGRIQKQQHVHYVFFGSKAHLLERMFCDNARAFYNSALAMPLSKPPPGESREFIRSHFADAGIQVGESEVEAILRVSDNIPYYLQAIASFVFEAIAISGRDAVEAADVQRAADDLVASNAAYYAVVQRGLSDSQKGLVLALAQEPVGEFDEGYRLRYDLSASSTVHSALTELIKDGIVEEVDGKYHIGDPILSRYILSSPSTVIQ